MTGDTETIRQAGRERLRRMAEDGERLYRIRMHGSDGESVADGNRIDGILTLGLADALGYVDFLLAALGRVEEREAALEEALEEACDWLDVDLAHAPNTATSMADRELVARWRAALFSSTAGSGEE